MTDTAVSPADVTGQGRTITSTAQALRDGTVTSRQLVEEGYALADAHDKALGVYLLRFDETALAAADAADADLAAGRDKGPLHGIPLGIKDIIATDEGPTTAQSLILDPTWGDQGDAPVVARLRAAGAIITGKLTTMEFAIGRPDFDKPFPIPRNPWNPERWTGGSSSGTGNGVASGMFLGGLGTDTGGSIRIPAAFCGITGLKQTYGLVPKAGCVPLGLTYDHIGPMARSAADCAAMLAVLAGPHPADPTSVDVAFADPTAALTGDLAGMRVGVAFADTVARSEEPGLAARMEEAVAVLAAAGADVVEVEFPYYQALHDACSVGFAGEALSWHRRFLQERWLDYGAPTRAAIIGGAFLDSSDYVQAQRVRRLGREAVGALLRDVDVIVTPTALTSAPPVDGIGVRRNMDSMCTPAWNSLGFPALSVPAGFADDGMPVGLQIGAAPFADAVTLKVGDAFQQRTDWHLRVPPLD